MSIVDRARPDASTASALASRTATQPGPLSAQAMSTMSARARFERAGHMIGDRVVDRAAAEQRGEPRTPGPFGLPDRDQPGAAFLHGLAGPGRASAAFQPGVAGAQGGMPGEGQFPGRGEDPDQVVRLGRPGGQHEGGFRQVRPAREQLHLLVAEAVGTKHDRDRVTEVRSLGEDIHLTELMGHDSECRCPSPSAVSAGPAGPPSAPAPPAVPAAAGCSGRCPPRWPRPLPAAQAHRVTEDDHAARAPTSGSRLRNAPATSADTRLCPKANSVNGSSVPPTASAATASTGPGPAGTPGAPSVTTVKASAPRAAPGTARR